MVWAPTHSSVSFFWSAANWASTLDCFKSFNNPKTVSMASLALVPVYTMDTLLLVTGRGSNPWYLWRWRGQPMTTRWRRLLSLLFYLCKNEMWGKNDKYYKCNWNFIYMKLNGCYIVGSTKTSSLPQINILHNITNKLNSLASNYRYNSSAGSSTADYRISRYLHGPLSHDASTSCKMLRCPHWQSTFIMQPKT